MKKLLWKLRAFLETKVLKTSLSSAIWRLRHIYAGRDWLQKYKESISHSHRDYLADMLLDMGPFESLVEAGACVGSNLYVMAKRYPDSKFCGVEINPAAVAEGNAWLRESGLENVRLVQGDIAAHEACCLGGCDLVLTDAALMYIGPEKIEAALLGLRKLARRGMLLNEWHCKGRSRYLDGHWMHDYAGLADKLFPGARLEFKKTPPGMWHDDNWDTAGGVLLVRFT
ncbi:MAG TPA: class I SAM-dependent methyltransferase [Elusimicrobiales bacterium]|nr:class I SAM-dependent methyltransferase [Elusimicrobiales bacterium]